MVHQACPDLNHYTANMTKRCKDACMCTPVQHAVCSVPRATRATEAESDSEFDSQNFCPVPRATRATEIGSDSEFESQTLCSVPRATRETKP